MAKLFYQYDSFPVSRAGSLPQSKLQQAAVGASSLTLANLKLHDQFTQDANNAFLPKMNRLVRNVAGRPTTQFSGQHSIFEALYELENFGQPDEETKSTAEDTSLANQHQQQPERTRQRANLSQEEYQD